MSHYIAEHWAKAVYSDHPECMQTHHIHTDTDSQAKKQATILCHAGKWKGRWKKREYGFVRHKYSTIRQQVQYKEEIRLRRVK